MTLTPRAWLVASEARGVGAGRAGEGARECSALEKEAGEEAEEATRPPDALPRARRRTGRGGSGPPHTRAGPAGPCVVDAGSRATGLVGVGIQVGVRGVEDEGEGKGVRGGRRGL